MSRIGYSTSAIVTDVLVLYLDSVNPKSYPGTETTCYDLSGSRNHGSLVDFTGSTTAQQVDLIHLQN